MGLKAMLKNPPKNPFPGLIVFFGFCLCLFLNHNCEGNYKGDPNYFLKDVKPSDVPLKPIIIWFHWVETDPEILRVALSSGIFSHVTLEGLHEWDRPNYPNNANVKKLVALCKKEGVKLIWTRWLWPGYKLRGFTFKDACDIKYYTQRIRNIKQEAKLIGADFVAFDAEPYARNPMKPMKTGRLKLSEAEFDVLNNAVQRAIKIEGQVDFIYPAGRIGKHHLYSATYALGKTVIGTHANRDIPWRRRLNRPYDIFGAYVNIKKNDPNCPDGPGPYFTAREILERQELWVHKKGLWIYPGTAGRDIERVAAVAREFSRIKHIEPVGDSNDSR